MKILKYAWIARVSFLSRAAYLADQFFSTIFLVFILFVYYQLWKLTLAGQPNGMVNGYGLREMLWYLLGTEFLILSLPRVHMAIGEEIRSGDIAQRLNKPFDYLIFHYANCAGESLIRFLSILAIGSLLLILMIGLPSLSWSTIPVVLLVFIFAHLLNFLWSTLIGLFAFWTEDVTGIYFLLDRTKWVLGGMLLPLTIYPASWQKWLMVLPFRYMIYDPARLLVQFEWSALIGILGGQLFWIMLFSGICSFIFTKGTRKVSIHGG